MDDECRRLGCKLFTFLVALMVLVGTWFVTQANTKSDMMRDAVKKGHAHYETDKETGRAFIEWNKDCSSPSKAGPER